MFGILLNTLVVPPRASHHPFWCPPLSLSSFLVSLIIVPHHLSIAQNKLFLLHPITLAIVPYHTLTTPLSSISTTLSPHVISITYQSPPKEKVFFSFQCSTSTPHPSPCYTSTPPCPVPRSPLHPSAPNCMFVTRKVFLKKNHLDHRYLKKWPQHPIKTLAHTFEPLFKTQDNQIGTS
jgi:hypothetical protein